MSPRSPEYEDAFQEISMTDSRTDDGRILPPDAPAVPGLSFRRFAGEADFPSMVAVMKAAKIADGLEETSTPDDVSRTYRHLVNCNPDRDMLVAEVDGAMIGYGRGWWEDTWSGTRTYGLFVHMKPEWRGKGIRRAMLRWIEARMRHVATEHPANTPKAFQTGGMEQESDWIRLIESEGYSPVRWGHLMVRPLDEPIKTSLLPDGLEIRPVKPSEILAIWRAAEEAFRDHWGHGEWKDEYLEEWRESPTFQPSLWQVAWDGVEVVGMVLNRSDEAENEEYGRKRGYTETICVRRPWRGRGVARALITQSLLMWHRMGMTEAAHGVDTQNEHGALQLYESLGYKATKTFVSYRKPLDLGEGGVATC
jgi:mycothiol synthase